MNSWNSDDLMQQVLITSKYEEIDWRSFNESKKNMRVEYESWLYKEWVFFWLNLSQWNIWTWYDLMNHLLQMKQRIQIR
jgi:hypothetical protein